MTLSAAPGRSQASSHRSAEHGGVAGSLDERIQALRAQGIHSVLTTFTDLPGGPKGKLVPLEGLPGAVSSGAGFSGPSISGTGLPRMGARSEYMGRVVPESLRPLPSAWRMRCAMVLPAVNRWTPAHARCSSARWNA